MLLDEDEVDEVETPPDPVLVSPPEVEPPNDEDALVLEVPPPVEVDDDPPAELDLETLPEVDMPPLVVGLPLL